MHDVLAFCVFWGVFTRAVVGGMVELCACVCCTGCVWAVAFLADGDLVTACADGVARVWSTDASRAADADVLQVF